MVQNHLYGNGRQDGDKKVAESSKESLVNTANWATKEFRGSVVMLDDFMPGFDEWLTGRPKKKDGWMIP